MLAQPVPAGATQELARQQIAAQPAEGERGQEEKVVCGHQAEDHLEWDAQHPVEQGERVEREVDADGPELPAAVEGILGPVNERVLDPPQVPRQRRVVDSIARHVGQEVRGHGPGQDEAEHGVCEHDCRDPGCRASSRERLVGRHQVVGHGRAIMPQCCQGFQPDDGASSMKRGCPLPNSSDLTVAGCS